MHPVKEMRSQLELWKHYFIDTEYELNDLEEKNNVFISRKHSKKDTAEAERFRHEFSSLKAAIAPIIERLNFCDEALSGKDPETLIPDDQLLECTTLNQAMEQFQAMYNSLKGNFRQKLKVAKTH